MSNGLADDPPLCSVILSVYNEALNLPTMYERLAAAVAGEPMRCEFIFVDDGSHDGSFEILEKLNARDSRVKVLRFSRNFGAQETSAAGLREAAGDCAILMASDLQDPPELIPELFRRWRDGYHVVWAKRTGRDDPFFRRLGARAYYALIRRLAIPDYPTEGTGGFCLIGRPVIDALNLLEERNRLTFELILWCGYTSAEVPYRRPSRFRGVQKWTFSRNLKAGIDGLLALSFAPIRWIMAFGLLVAALSFLGGLYVLAYALLFGFHTLGWASLMVSMLFLGGTQLVCIGFLGEYLWRILQECRRRPIYLVRGRIGEFGPASAARQTAVRNGTLQETAHEHLALP
jgi:dolichol-phosphate mannosyltransferase